MKKLKHKIIRYTTKITDMLYYLLPLELLLALLWVLSLVCIWIINQLSFIISWDNWSQIRDGVQIGQSRLFQAMVIILVIYLFAHILLSFIWIKEDKLLNFLLTLNETRSLRKRMYIIGKKEDEELLNRYHKALRSAQCLITSEEISLSVLKTHVEEIDTNLRRKLIFSCNFLRQKYGTLYSFTDITETSEKFSIEGS